MFLLIKRIRFVFLLVIAVIRGARMVRQFLRYYKKNYRAA